VKTNHISTEHRLRNHIHKLQGMINFGDYWTKHKYYPRCRYCNITNVSCNMAEGQHNPGCKVNGVEKEIANYTQLLESERSS
jgi:hypothetical protein